MKLCDTCTGSAFLALLWLLCSNSNHPSSEGTFLISTHPISSNQSTDRGLSTRTTPRVRLPCQVSSRQGHSHGSPDRSNLTDSRLVAQRSWRICGVYYALA